MKQKGCLGHLENILFDFDGKSTFIAVTAYLYQLFGCFARVCFSIFVYYY